MSLLYRLIAKRSPRNPDGPLKFYAMLSRKKTLQNADLNKKIAKKTRQAPADIYRFMIALTETIENELASGKAVKIDGLGTFSLKLNSTGKHSMEEFNSNDIKSIKLHFYQDPHWKSALKGLALQQKD